MENHLSKLYTIAELEPGWSEDIKDPRVKTTPRNQGSMKMALRRISRVPENARIYSKGDPVHLIDWKAYARTDELIMREHRDQASSNIGIVLDWRRSMDWPRKSDIEKHGGIGAAMSKLEVETRVGFYLAHNYLIAGDSVTFGFLDAMGDVSRIWRPRSAGDVMSLFETGLRDGFNDALDSFAVAGTWNPPAFDRLWWISDFLSDGAAPDNWRQLRSLAVIHIFSWIELDSSWIDKPTSYRENADTRKIYLGSELTAGARWAEEIHRWQDRIKLSASRAGGHYLAVSDKTAVGDFFHWLVHEVSHS